MVQKGMEIQPHEILPASTRLEPKMKTINFTRYKLEALKDSCSQAEAESRDEFTFEGQELYVPYAKYLIGFLEQKFEPHRQKVEIDNKGESIRFIP